MRTDVTDEESVQGALDTARDVFGSLHGLINCAGVGPAKRVLGRKGPHPLEDFDRVVQINLVGTFNPVRLAAAVMAENEPTDDGERGVIVNTASDNYLHMRKSSPLSRLQREMRATVVNGLIGGAP